MGAVAIRAVDASETALLPARDAEDGNIESIPLSHDERQAVFTGTGIASGLYTVTTSDKGFTLVPRGGAQELMFQFDEQDANGQFMITVPQAAEP